MALMTIPSDVNIKGRVSAEQMSVPAGAISDAQVAADAGIQSTKLEHRIVARHTQLGGSDVASQSEVVDVCTFAATLDACEVLPDVAPTGGNKQYTVDLQKSTNAGAFASILSAVATVGNSAVNRTVILPTISNSALVAGDALKVVVTASGTTGNQGQGLCVRITRHEDPS